MSNNDPWGNTSEEVEEGDFVDWPGVWATGTKVKFKITYLKKKEGNALANSGKPNPFHHSVDYALKCTDSNGNSKTVWMSLPVGYKKMDFLCLRLLKYVGLAGKSDKAFQYNSLLDDRIIGMGGIVQLELDENDGYDPKEKVKSFCSKNDELFTPPVFCEDVDVHMKRDTAPSGGPSNDAPAFDDEDLDGDIPF